MRFDILTVFPDFFESPLRAGVLGRALAAGLVDCRIHNLRDWTHDRHRTTDDTPYGGGGGMVMRAEPLLAALRQIRGERARNFEDLSSNLEQEGEAPGESAPEGRGLAPKENPEDRPPEAASHVEEGGMRQPQVVYLSPQGEPLSRRLVCELATEPGLILLCGAYEGIDERVVELEVDREVSIGDYVLTSGEPAALVLLNAVARRLEGVVGNPASVPNDSFEGGLLDFPHYTRPETVEGLGVPEVLLSGHHAKIEAWRRERQLERTARRRPDLLAGAELSKKDRAFLSELMKNSQKTS